MFNAYKNYPFPIPLRTKIFNLVRLFFLTKIGESFLERRLSKSNRFWRRLIPPLYFYRHGSKRKTSRDGLVYELDLSQMLDHSIYFYDLADVAWSNLFHLIKPNFNIIDAGANIGYLTMQFAKRCPEGTVYSFEPDQDNYNSLSRNVALNDFKNAILFKYGVGETHRLATLYKMYRNNPGANRIMVDMPELAYAQEEIEIVTIDEMSSNHVFKRIHLMKIDVEGFELMTLKGAKRLIERDRPILFIELIDENLNGQGYAAKDLLDYIRGLEYTILDARTMKPLVKADSYHTDIICSPVEERNLQ